MGLICGLTTTSFSGQQPDKNEINAMSFNAFYQEKISVVFDHRIFSAQQYGGVSRYFAGLVAPLGRYGISAKVLAPLHQNAYLSMMPQELVSGYRIPKFKGSAQICLAANPALSRLAMSSFPPRIVHETYYGAEREAPKAAAVVLTVYDMINEIYEHLFENSQLRLVKTAAILRADLIICISESTRSDLLRFFPEVEARTRVTHLAYDPTFTMDGPHPTNIEKPYLLYVGARRAYKNFTALLDAYAMSPTLQNDFNLICIGGGDFDYNERDMISRLGLRDRVQQRQADDAQLREWYRSAAVFVYPSLYEGFGIPPLEAMALGCPVVGVRSSSVPEVCGDGAEFAPNGSPEALHEAIVSVVYDSARSESLRLAGYEQIRRFSWEKAAYETSEIYRELV
jgi:glycosyltransferase involved in cell wall biosynthesis